MIKALDVDVIVSEKHKTWDKRLFTAHAFGTLMFDSWVYEDESAKKDTGETRDRGVNQVVVVISKEEMITNRYDSRWGLKHVYRFCNMEGISDFNKISFGEVMKVETKLQRLRNKQEVRNWNSILV